MCAALPTNPTPNHWPTSAMTGPCCHAQAGSGLQQLACTRLPASAHLELLQALLLLVLALLAVLPMECRRGDGLGVAKPLLRHARPLLLLGLAAAGAAAKAAARAAAAIRRGWLVCMAGEGAQVCELSRILENRPKPALGKRYLNALMSLMCLSKGTNPLCQCAPDAALPSRQKAAPTQRVGAAASAAQRV